MLAPFLTSWVTPLTVSQALRKRITNTHDNRASRCFIVVTFSKGLHWCVSVLFPYCSNLAFFRRTDWHQKPTNPAIMHRPGQNLPMPSNQERLLALAIFIVAMSIGTWLIGSAVSNNQRKRCKCISRSEICCRVTGRNLRILSPECAAWVRLRAGAGGL